MTDQTKQIAEYYDKTLPFYKIFWHGDDESYALHYGFWDKDTKSVKEALLNENKFLADILKISFDIKILDAGCGIGGSTIWLAKNFDVSVAGITLSEKQLEKARQLAKNHGVQGRVEFHLQDFLNTKFPNDYFDIVWAIESVCHAENKKEFLQEAHRILKPEGKIIVADGVLKRDVRDSEKEIYKDFLDGLVLPNLAKIDDFENWMKEVGFRNVRFWDKTEEVKPSSKILYRRTLMLHPFAKILHRFGLISSAVFKNGPAGIAQYKLVQTGAGGYGVFYAEK